MTDRTLAALVERARADIERVAGPDADTALLAWGAREAALDYWIAAGNVPLAVATRALRPPDGPAEPATPILDALAA